MAEIKQEQILFSHHQYQTHTLLYVTFLSIAKNDKVRLYTMFTCSWWELHNDSLHTLFYSNIIFSKQTIIGSENGLPPSQHQAINWTNVGVLLIRTLGTNFSEILCKIHKFSFRKINFKMSSGKWRPSCLCLNVLVTDKIFGCFTGT